MGRRYREISGDMLGYHLLVLWEIKLFIGLPYNRFIIVNYKASDMRLGLITVILVILIIAVSIYLFVINHTATSQNINKTYYLDGTNKTFYLNGTNAHLNFSLVVPAAEFTGSAYAAYIGGAGTNISFPYSGYVILSSPNASKVASIQLFPNSTPLLYGPAAPSQYINLGCPVFVTPELYHLFVMSTETALPFFTPTTEVNLSLKYYGFTTKPFTKEEHNYTSFNILAIYNTTNTFTMNVPYSGNMVFSIITTNSVEHQKPSGHSNIGDYAAWEIANYNYSTYSPSCRALPAYTNGFFVYAGQIISSPESIEVVPGTLNISVYNENLTNITYEVKVNYIENIP